MALDLISVHAKIAHAAAHARALNDEIAAWRSGNPNTPRVDVDAAGTCYEFRVSVTRALDRLRIGLLLGDAIANARSALDHLIHAIAAEQNQGRPLTRDQQFRLMFPIADADADFRKLEARRLMILSAPVRDAIRAMQPYIRLPQPPQRGTIGALAILRDLNNADKHHVVTPVVQARADGQIKVWVPGDSGIVPVPDFPHPDHVEDGTVLARFTLDRPVPELKYEFRVGLSVAVRHRGGKSTVEGLLTGPGAILDQVREVVRVVSGAV